MTGMPVKPAEMVSTHPVIGGIVTTLYQLSLDNIIQGYDKELQLPREHEVGYGFELFRRAIEERDNLAWETLYQRHCRLIYSWIHNTVSIRLTVQEREDLIQEIWMKFYRNIIRCGTPLSNHFQHVGGLFNYLKKCVLTVIRDHQRRRAKENKLHKKLETYAPQLYSAPETFVLNSISRQAQAEAVNRWIISNITDPEEQLIISCSYKQGLTPREIVKHYPDQFHNVQKVYRIKERILKRARRSFEMTIW